MPEAVHKTPPTDPDSVKFAREHPGEWAHDFDRKYPGEAYIPVEAVRGSWRVTHDGIITDEYYANERYRPIERRIRTLPEFMHALARTMPREWIVEVDPSMESLFPDVPKDKWVGYWYVDEHGEITDLFRPNSSYIPPNT